MVETNRDRGFEMQTLTFETLRFRGRSAAWGPFWFSGQHSPRNLQEIRRRVRSLLLDDGPSYCSCCKRSSAICRRKRRRSTL